MSESEWNQAVFFERVCHRYRVEMAADLLGMGQLWPDAVRRETLRRVRSLPTYDRVTDTVVVCRYVWKDEALSRLGAGGEG